MNGVIWIMTLSSILIIKLSYSTICAYARTLQPPLTTKAAFNILIAMNILSSDIYLKFKSVLNFSSSQQNLMSNAVTVKKSEAQTNSFTLEAFLKNLRPFLIIILIWIYKRRGRINRKLIPSMITRTRKKVVILC